MSCSDKRRGEPFYESKGVIVILLLHSNLANLLGTKAIAITPHFVRYAIPTGRTISNKVWVVIAIIHSMGMREPECRIICNHFPHLFIYEQVRTGEDRQGIKVIS